MACCSDPVRSGAQRCNEEPWSPVRVTLEQNERRPVPTGELGPDLPGRSVDVNPAAMPSGMSEAQAPVISSREVRTRRADSGVYGVAAPVPVWSSRSRLAKPLALRGG